MNAFDNLWRRKPKPLHQTEWYIQSPASSVGWYWSPRVTGPGDYPLDTDFSERFIRPKRGIDFFPVPGENIRADVSADGIQLATFMAFADVLMRQGNVAMVELGSIKRASIGPYPNFDDIYVASFNDIATPDQRKTG